VKSIITFFPGGGVGRGQIHMTTEDGSESATVDYTEYFQNEGSTAISIAYFSTNSTGMLAPLNNKITVSLDEERQLNGDIIVTLLEWEAGTPATGNNNDNNSTSNGNDTTTTT
jgi:hypothetical protein